VSIVFLIERLPLGFLFFLCFGVVTGGYPSRPSRPPIALVPSDLFPSLFVDSALTRAFLPFFLWSRVSNRRCSGFSSSAGIFLKPFFFFRKMLSFRPKSRLFDQLYGFHFLPRCRMLIPLFFLRLGFRPLVSVVRVLDFFKLRARTGSGIPCQLLSL